MRNPIDSNDATTAVPTGTVRPTRVRFADVPVVAVVVPFSPEDRAR
jgi:hypothetical protein